MDEDEYTAYLSAVFNLSVEGEFAEYEIIRDADGVEMEGCYRTLPKPDDQ